MTKRTKKKTARRVRGVKPLDPALRRPERRVTNNTLRALDPGWSVAVDPAARVLRVLAVTTAAEAGMAEFLVWRFQAAVTAVEGDAAPQLEASVDGVNFVAPATVIAEADGTVTAIYDGMNFAAGALYRVTAPPTNLTFAAGRCMIPQIGIVSPPPPAVAPSAAAFTTTAGKRMGKIAAKRRAA